MLISRKASAHTLEAACRLLHVLLTDSPPVHLQVATGTGVQDLISLLKAPSAGVRHAAAGALSHMLFPRAMPGWQYSNDVINKLGMMSKFQQELAALRARNKHAHQGDMLVDELHDTLGFADRRNSGAVSAAATESSGDQSE